VITGADGTWLMLTPTFAREDIGALLQQACGRLGLRFERTSEYSFKMTRAPDSETPVTHTLRLDGWRIVLLSSQPHRVHELDVPGNGGKRETAGDTAQHRKRHSDNLSSITGRNGHASQLRSAKHPVALSLSGVSRIDAQ
jgi:hypothetical protein